MKKTGLDPLFEKLGKLSQTHRILIGSGIAVLVIVIFVFVSFKPNWTKISELEDDLAKVEKDLREATRKADAFDSVNKQIEEAEEKFHVAKNKLPDDKAIDEVLKGISTSGRDAGIEFSEFRPTNVKNVDFYAEIPIKMTIVGDFHSFLTFCDLVARMPRIVSIKNLSISPGDEKNPANLSTTCTAVTYKFLSEAEQEAAAGKGKKKKKAKKKRKKKKKGGHG